MDNSDKFEYPSLPSKDTFYSRFRLSGISKANYTHALNVYNKFKCSKFLDYHMLYLGCDLILLAENIEPTYLLGVDANTLYVLAMCQHLPYSDIKLNNDILFDDVINTSDESDIGYMVEVGLSVPKATHEL